MATFKRSALSRQPRGLTMVRSFGGSWSADSAGVELSSRSCAPPMSLNLFDAKPVSSKPSACC